MPKFIRILFYLLVVVLPSQTLLLVFGITRLQLPEIVGLWKELVSVVLIIFLSKNIFDSYLGLGDLAKFKNFKIIYKIKPLWPILVFLMLNLIIVLNSFVFNSTNINVFFYGYRFELWWLGFFAIVITWLNFKKLLQNFSFPDDFLVIKEKFTEGLTRSILAGFLPVMLVTILEIFFGQGKVLSFFGFDDIKSGGLVSQASSCNLVDFGNSNCRISGTFSTPNHFAAYLLFILAFLIIALLTPYIPNKQKLNTSIIHRIKKFDIIGLIVLTIGFLGLSVSRFSWLGVCVFVSILILYYLSNKLRFNLKVIKMLMVISLIFPVFIGVIAINLNPEGSVKILPDAVSKPSSTIEHYRHTISSVEVIKTSGRYLQGFGLGASGSVAKSQYQDLEQNPIYKNYTQIALNNFLAPERITIPENWYLQVVLNGGLIYFVLYLALVLYPLKEFYAFLKSLVFDKKILVRMVFATVFFGILIGNLFLHVWENQTVSLYWTIFWLWGELTLDS